MTSRMFVAVTPPEDVLADLDRYVEPRRLGDSPLRWTSAHGWHVTLAFCAEVPDHAEDELIDRLHDAAGRHAPLELRLTGAGAFPDAAAAKVLWTGVAGEVDRLTSLSSSTRGAANRAGVAVEGGPFRPHVTLARSNRPLDVTRWLRPLDLFDSRPWRVTEFELIRSDLRSGQSSRYQGVERFPLAGDRDDSPEGAG